MRLSCTRIIVEKTHPPQYEALRAPFAIAPYVAANGFIDSY
jgi:hypothetical protein